LVNNEVVTPNYPQGYVTTFDTSLLTNESTKVFGNSNKFPFNPNELLSELPRDTKGRIFPNKTTRIRPEQHPLKPGETFNPRHHGQHYHIEIRIDSSKSWNSKGNVIKITPPGYILYFLHLKFWFSLASLYRKIRFELHS
jgi:hypothetical protein